MAAIKLPSKPSKLLVPGLVILLFISAILLTNLWTRVSLLEKGGSTKTATQGTTGTAPTQPTDPYSRVDASTLNIPEVTEGDHIRGAKDAPLTWIEYSDLECPFCQRIHPSLVQALDEYKGQLRWVYRHFPLDSIHPRARPAANASECVSSLGGNEAFWKFVDALFEGAPTSLGEAQLSQNAASAGANQASFESCLKEERFADKIVEQENGGQKAGVNGTPGSFLLDNKGNAWVIPGAVPYTTIKQIIDGALAL